MKAFRGVRYALYAGLGAFAFWAVMRRPAPAPWAADPSATEMEIYSVEPLGFKGEHELLLRAKGEAPQGKRYLPIIIGPFEGRAIQMGLNGILARRPQTHDLLKRVSSSFDMRIEKITVTKLERGTFFAELTLLKNGRKLRIDARPSDSVALATRVGCPIFAVDQVLLDAGMEEPQRKEFIPSLPEGAFF